jgi:hypothetical protein
MKKVVIIIAALIGTAQAQKDSTKRPIPVQKFKVWVNGASVDATDIDVDCVEDDLATFANFKYMLKDSAGVTLAMGFLKMTGVDYRQYITLNNHADRAEAWVLRELRIQRRQQVAAAQAARAAATGGTITKQ